MGADWTDDEGDSIRKKKEWEGFGCDCILVGRRELWLVGGVSTFKES